MLSLSRSQLDLLSTLSASYTDGLATSDASRRRSDSGGVLNVVLPPINCPKWVCCLLPCIKSIPSMKLFRQIEPEDAEVMRDGRWVRYDAASLVKGDIVRLSDGDAVPADCVVLSLGMDHAATGGDGKMARGGGGGSGGGSPIDHGMPETVDVIARNVGGRGQIVGSIDQAVLRRTGAQGELHRGGDGHRAVDGAGEIDKGRAVAPKGDLSGEIEAERTEGEDDDEANISLIDRAA
eukprot:CAMPEP_0113533894 /NCGR_PEP_ID=MMETSP0015_2-20120614/4867_1 /TAXON_ID=2838 /ORGANISM="Odontella" /LENGTH=235 /DNA_ID=CAMNT_0000433015 /DNA_START=324 /DNA_END=1033 /DNA_ORIENTATION=+ /assembly_acc=CAM_ASM_000160